MADRQSLSMTRRQWLIGSALGTIALGSATRGEGADETETEAIRAAALKAGLKPFRAVETEHYLGIGDAPDAFRDQALKICKELAAVYQKHFPEKGFAVTFPARRLTVVTLKDRDSYAAFVGEAPGEDVGGHYDVDRNRLVVFDNRPRQADLAARSERINTFTLVHEALHQLTYNTGLLDPRGDVPVALSEGLAMYGELWQPGRRADLGGVNRPRLKVIIDHFANAGEWRPVESVLTDDDLFSDGATQQLAYAEAWALVHYHLKTRAKLPKVRAYLDATRPRRDARHRLDDAKAHLGPLDALDAELRKYVARLNRGG